MFTVFGIFRGRIFGTYQFSNVAKVVAFQGKNSTPVNREGDVSLCIYLFVGTVTNLFLMLTTSFRIDKLTTTPSQYIQYCQLVQFFTDYGEIAFFFSSSPPSQQHAPTPPHSLPFDAGAQPAQKTCLDKVGGFTGRPINQTKGYDWEQRATDPLLTV